MAQFLLTSTDCSVQGSHSLWITSHTGQMTPSEKDALYRNPAVQLESAAWPPWKLLTQETEELTQPLLSQCTHPLGVRAPFSSTFSSISLSDLLLFSCSVSRQEASGFSISDCVQHCESPLHILKLWIARQFSIMHREMPE